MSSKEIQRVFKVWKDKNGIERTVAPPSLESLEDKIANFFAPGPYYYYVFNFENLKMEYVHPSVVDILGIPASDFTAEKYISRHHPEDLATFNEKENTASEFLFNYLKPSEVPHYKVVYVNRVLRSDGSYAKILHQAKALSVTEDGKIQYVLGVHTEISHLKIPIDNKVSFIGDADHPSYYNVDAGQIKFTKEQDITSEFTAQELKIIALIADGNDSKQIAEKLFIAESTVKTHRKNILAKSDAKNTAHLIANCIRKGLI